MRFPKGAKRILEQHLIRMEAERDCELPELMPRALIARIYRLLDCEDPPQGPDRDYLLACLRLLGVRREG